MNDPDGHETKGEQRRCTVKLRLNKKKLVSSMWKHPVIRRHVCFLLVILVYEWLLYVTALRDEVICDKQILHKEAQLLWYPHEIWSHILRRCLNSGHFSSFLGRMQPTSVSEDLHCTVWTSWLYSDDLSRCCRSCITSHIKLYLHGFMLWNSSSDPIMKARSFFSFSFLVLENSCWIKKNNKMHTIFVA